MGYRSEVAYKIRMNQNVLANETHEEHLAKFKQFVLECKSMDESSRAMREYEDKDITKYADQQYIDYDRCEIVFHHQGLKWYEEFEDVKSHHAIMNHALSWNDEEWEERFDIAFARVGEEQDDIETEYHGSDGYQLLGTHTSIWIE